MLFTNRAVYRHVCFTSILAKILCAYEVNLQQVKISVHRMLLEKMGNIVYHLRVIVNNVIKCTETKFNKIYCKKTPFMGDWPSPTCDEKQILSC